jgi:hypothetical protein
MNELENVFQHFQAFLIVPQNKYSKSGKKYEKLLRAVGFCSIQFQILDANKKLIFRRKNRFV